MFSRYPVLDYTDDNEALWEERYPELESETELPVNLEWNEQRGPTTEADAILRQYLISSDDVNSRKHHTATNNEHDIRSYSPTKRSCRSFPCMFTHIAGSAGNAAMNKMKLDMIRGCVSDPECFTAG